MIKLSGEEADELIGKLVQQGFSDEEIHERVRLECILDERKEKQQT